MNESIETIIEKIPLCQGLTAAERTEVAAICERVRFESDEKLIVEGRRSRDMFAVLSGRVRVCKCDDNGKERTLAELGSQTILGELGLVLDTPRTATVVAIDPTEVLKFDGTTILECIAANRLFVYKMAFNVLRYTASRFEDLNRETLRMMEEAEEGENDTALMVDDVTRLRDKLFREWTF